jgi:hypothetical protein
MMTTRPDPDKSLAFRQPTRMSTNRLHLDKQPESRQAVRTSIIHLWVTSRSHLDGPPESRQTSTISIRHPDDPPTP